ncbi:hypothetical protein [Leptospira yasudae]|uniref:Lipoprotein n=1 Tax=Leptospira yasudae TaxID=2202201 RepID=A0A6N4QEN4_9LEPT|nr:hypothetical protein [Leptospira yasudae]TGL76724.1 hypothetical protein EHQ72_12900 [Leptospira yasudae]TGL82012.1 hypothetical protein EHQ83_14370 [Leptospira yasudae]TGL84157.1 hypothetical protein EHQ77_00355 [Leptospira yasudae]
MKKAILVLLILVMAIACKPKETDEEKSDKLFMDIIMASVLLNPCNTGVRFSSGASNFTVADGQALTVCADQNGTPTVTFAKAGSYRLIGINGSQTHFSSRCNSNYSDFGLTVKDGGNTTVLTSSTVGATADITVTANAAYTITVTGVASTSPYSCNGVRASISTTPARLTITPI